VHIEVQGRWAGTIYVRQFTTPNGKPYLFLGRHRVLVTDSSTLAIHIEKLAKENRKVALATLVANLLENERGFTPAAIAHLV
jgi:hypothetical protein